VATHNAAEQRYAEADDISLQLFRRSSVRGKPVIPRTRDGAISLATDAILIIWSQNSGRGSPILEGWLEFSADREVEGEQAVKALTGLDYVRKTHGSVGYTSGVQRREAQGSTQSQLAHAQIIHKGHSHGCQRLNLVKDMLFECPTMGKLGKRTGLRGE